MTQGKYANVNGLNMYYEIHGTGKPLVLLHGALSAIGTSFGKLLPSLAKNRQVIAIEQQAHGHTEDIDHPLTIKQMADDTVALLRQLNIENADFFGYSMGAGIALYIAIQYPDLVRKLVVASVTYNNNGIRPELLAGMENLKPENLAGTPMAGGICKYITESGRLAHTGRQSETTESAHSGLARRGDSVNKGAHPGYNRRFRYCPPRACCKDVPIARRRSRRHRQSFTIPACCAFGHNTCVRLWTAPIGSFR